MTTDALPDGGVITYDAMDLMWMDGLDDIRSIFQAREADPAEQIPAEWQCRTLEELQWYCMREGLPCNEHQFGELPTVDTLDLLWDLGVPEHDLTAMVKRLTHANLPMLRKAVLPQFAQEAVALMDDQLPELKLLEKMQKGMLFLTAFRVSKSQTLA